ncbi:FxsB family cyclophane-forming radical SAM/SPASM peptide maturase [Yinghuangia soli]|uniref:FxsB family radical SAM/SPASM domain protein n=1 Tax=Yinghuangia soli TaxID=2908204 RepID=A0AA41PYB0_9ACTN|nr:FxsB family cyclophane-forming radical SAM/SPASM peptide maturase [Yinghuangia soli]MCF2526707.1 FxsB family radical SAM/SPASM domain protein [Yinghuangia soli]
MELLPTPARVRTPAEWPLNVPSHRAFGALWHPIPLRHFVVKVHSRCNLACDYCYLYEMADQSWQAAGKAMSPEAADQTAFRIGEHAREHRLDAVTVIVHGGEPMLVGMGLITRLAEAVRRAVPDYTQVSLAIQTNGLLLDDASLDALYALGVSVGVSLDGGEAANDRHRRYADGRGSHAAVAEAVARLRAPSRPGLFGGLLCTIDLANDPVEVYEDLLSLAPPAMDFLLPHGSWDTPPPSRDEDAPTAPYGDWLAAAFDRWYGTEQAETSVRLFEDVLSLLLGGPSRSEQLGPGPASVVVIDTDGMIEQVDTLKSVYDGAAATGMSVTSHSFDDALRHPGLAARQLGAAGLGATCRACQVRDVCGGGYFTHRYRAGAGFGGPSVYCPDLIRFIEHVRGRLTADLARARDVEDTA